MNLLLASWLGLVFCSNLRAVETRHDVILISIDMLRADALGVYSGDASASPRIDAFAAGAVTFENAYANASFTVPSHMTMMTGLDPFVHQVVFNGPPNPKPPVPLLAERFKAAGFETAAFTAGVVDAERFSPGFDQFTNFGYKTTDPAIGFREASSWLSRPRSGKPRFLFVHTWHVHNFPQDKATYPFDAGFVYDPEIAKSLIQQYRIAVRQVDAAVGEFLEGVPRDAVVVLTSDHGQNFYEPHGPAPLSYGHGADPYDTSLRVPLIVRMPDPGQAGSRVRPRVALVRLAATLAQAGGFQRQDERPLPLGPSSATDEADPIFFLGHGHRGGCVSGVIDGDEKLLRLGIEDQGPRRTLAWNLRADPAEQSSKSQEVTPSTRRLEALIVDHLRKAGFTSCLEIRAALGKMKRSEKTEAALKAAGYSR